MLWHYGRYGIQWSFPDETEEERNKRENKVKKMLLLKAKAETKAAKDGNITEIIGWSPKVREFRGVAASFFDLKS